MVFYGKKMFRKTYRAKKTNRATTYVSKNVKKYVKRALDKNIEDKYFILQPISGIFGSIATSWLEYSFFQPTQGISESQRVSNRIRMKTIKIYGVIATGASEVALDDPYNVVRVVIAIYKGSSGVTPLGTAGVTINQPINKISLLSASVSLEHLLMDKYIPLTVTSTEKGGGDGYTPMLKVFKYFKRIPWRYSNIFFGDNTVTYPDRRLIVSVISDSAANPNPGFIQGYVQCTFEDA